MNSPTVSVIIPCRNEEKYIVGCLDSIVASDYPSAKIQIYVVDGMSTDSTPGIIKAYAEKNPAVHYLKNPQKTTPYALNAGLKSSTSEVKIILGAHAEVYPDFITENVKALEAHPEAGCSGGVIENVIEDDVSAAIAQAMSSSFGVGNAHFRTGTREGYVDTVAFGAYKQEVFEKIGYFDEDLTRNQDDDFNFRLTRAGYKIWLSPSIRSKYFVRASFAKLWKQYYQYGYWKVFINRKHRTVTTLRQIVPVLFVSGLAGGILLSLIYPPLWAVLLSAVIFYLLTALYSAMSLTPKYSLWPKVILAFFILHFSYGTGYLEGIIQFLVLKKKPSVSKESMSR